MSIEILLWFIFCFWISLINLVAVIMRFKKKLTPREAWGWRFLLPVASIAFLILLGDVVLKILKLDFPQQNDFGFEHERVYQIISSLTMLLGALLVLLNLFTLTFFHGCYYSWQVWKNKIKDEDIEIKFSKY